MITILLQKILEQVKALKTNIENLPSYELVFSETPKIVGKWLDGSDVYQVVVKKAFDYRATTLYISTSSLNIANLISWNCFLNASDTGACVVADKDTAGQFTVTTCTYTGITCTRSGGQAWGDSPNVTYILRYTVKEEE